MPSGADRRGRLLVATHAGSAEEEFTDDLGEHFVFTYYERDHLAALVQRAGFSSVRAILRPPDAGELQVPKLIVSAVGASRDSLVAPDARGV